MKRKNRMRNSDRKKRRGAKRGERKEVNRKYVRKGGSVKK